MIQPAKKRKTKAKKAPKKAARKSANSLPIKSNPGIPAHVPTPALRGLVTLAVAAGRTQLQIASAMNISDSTLRKHYADELQDGGSKLILNIAATLATIAQNKNHPKCVTAAIFWLKTKGGFREGTPTVDPEDERVTFTINIGGSGPPPKLGGPIIDA
jgi:hypothetical protein